MNDIFQSSTLATLFAIGIYSVSAFTYEECLKDFSEYLKHRDYDYFEEISADEFYHPSK